MDSNKTIKVAVLYRVVQHWRAPIFQKMAAFPNVDLTVFYGWDFPGTKVVSGKNLEGFKNKKLFTLRIKKKIGKSGGRQMPFCPTLFFELIKLRPDIVLTEGSSNFANAIQGYLYAKLFRKKIIWWGLGKLANQSRTGSKDNFINYFEKRCDAHVVYSSVGKKYYESIGIPSCKIFTAVNVVNTDIVFEKQHSARYQEIKTSHVPFNILFVGAIQPGKRVDVLLHAYEKLSQHYKDVRLTIVGNGKSLEELQQYQQEHQIPNVTFTGAVIDGVENLFADADVFVLPGLGGLAVSEALAHGLPVIASIGDGCETDLVSTECGIIDKNLDETSLEKYLSHLHDHPQELSTMKENARKVIQERFNVHSYLGEIQKAFLFVMQ